MGKNVIFISEGIEGKERHRTFKAVQVLENLNKCLTQRTKCEGLEAWLIIVFISLY